MAVVVAVLVAVVVDDITSETPILLVGSKLDMRDDKGVANFMKGKGNVTLHENECIVYVSQEITRTP